MDFEKLFEKNFATLTSAAYRADYDLAHKMMSDAQSEWDSGITFCGMGYVLGDQRTGDSVDEIDAACGTLKSKLAGLVLDKWVKKLSREDVAALCSALSEFSGAAFVGVGDVRFSPFDIIDGWNKAHPDEKQIQYHTE